MGWQTKEFGDVGDGKLANVERGGITNGQIQRCEGDGRGDVVRDAHAALRGLEVGRTTAGISKKSLGVTSPSVSSVSFCSTAGSGTLSRSYRPTATELTPSKEPSASWLSPFSTRHAFSRLMQHDITNTVYLSTDTVIATLEPVRFLGA
jgi:hypothetical protein